VFKLQLQIYKILEQKANKNDYFNLVTDFNQS